MDAVSPGQARFFIKERQVKSGGPRPTPKQAALLLAAKPDVARPVKFATTAHPGVYLGAATSAPDAEGHTQALIVDSQGHRLPILGRTAPGCTPCRAALNAGPVVSRRVLGVGDVGGEKGEELFVEETTEAGSRLLVVLTAAAAPTASPDQAAFSLLRMAAFWFGTDQVGLHLLGEVATVEADADDDVEVAIIRTELPMLGDNLCNVRRRVEIYDLSARQRRRLDTRFAAAMGVAEMARGAEPVEAMVRAYDAMGDAPYSSRLCAAYLGRSQNSKLSGLCIGRVTQLRREGKLVEAVNAAGLLAEAASPLRAAVAGPFYQAVNALDRDPRLTVGDDNCTTSPLFEHMSKRSLGTVLAAARAAKAERINLGDLGDAVYVTGARDFGPRTPVGRMTARWLLRVQDTLPARYAAIEALLMPAQTGVPPPVSNTNPPATPPVAQVTPTVVPSVETKVPPQAVDPALGRPRIILKVHEE